MDGVEKADRIASACCRVAGAALSSNSTSFRPLPPVLITSSSQRQASRYAWLMENNQAERADAAVIKYYTAETYKSIADTCLQILGGYGYCMEYPMQRFYRDARLATIGGGTSEIQKNIIAATLGL